MSPGVDQTRQPKAPQEEPLVWLGWCNQFSSVIVKKLGWRGQGPHLLLTDSLRIPPPTPPSVDEESSGYDRRFDRKLTPVCPTPASLILITGGTSCKFQLTYLYGWAGVISFLL